MPATAITMQTKGCRFFMNTEQLQKTLRSSQYAEQVLGLHQLYLEQDYQIDQFAAPLSRENIFQSVENELKDIQDESQWMRVG